jgi:RNA polymerase sigma factor (sigma-70 family)
MGGRFMVDSAGAFMDGAGRYPLLTPSEEVELGRAVQLWLTAEDPSAAVVSAGLAARDRLVVCNMRWVASLASRYRDKTSLPFEDILQAGAVGLIKAAERFDFEKGFKFSTYATCWIRQGITRSIERTDPRCASRLPNWIQQNLAHYRRELADFCAAHGHYPSAADALAMREKLGISPDRWGDAVQWLGVGRSLDAPIGDGETTLAMMLPDPGPGPDVEAELTELREKVAGLLTELRPRERQALSLRFGIDGGGPLGLLEVGKIMGVSSERARQLCNKGIWQIRGRGPVEAEHETQADKAA